MDVKIVLSLEVEASKNKNLKFNTKDLWRTEVGQTVASDFGTRRQNFKPRLACENRTCTLLSIIFAVQNFRCFQFARYPSECIYRLQSTSMSGFLSLAGWTVLPKVPLDNLSREIQLH